jgi:hypothetical protein
MAGAMGPAQLESDRAVSEARSAEAVWLALSALATAVAGHRLFTVTTIDMEAGLAQRVFTSHPVEYPVSGTKPIHRDRWFDIVHGERRSFVANTIADIANVFPDYELIASLGCGSVLNLPVVLGGDLAATVNLLHHEHWYTLEKVSRAERILPLPAKLCCAWAPALGAAVLRFGKVAAV